MTTRIEVDFEDLFGFVEDMEDFVNGASLDLLLEQVGNLLVQQTLQRFSTETDPDGLAWARRKDNARPSQRTLEKTGRLRNSFRGGEGGISVDGDSVNVGTNVPYAKYHRRDDGRIPKREFLGIGLEDEREIRQLIEDFIRELDLV